MLQLEWDEPVPHNLHIKWSKWLDGLPMLNANNIERCYKPANFGLVNTTKLHHFTDASFSGVGACSYIRLVNDRKEVHVCLLMAKSRVILSKGKITIPR